MKPNVDKADLEALVFKQYRTLLKYFSFENNQIYLFFLFCFRLCPEQ